MFNAHLINPTEKRWVVIYSTLIVALTGLPYLIAYLATPTGWHFTWLLPNITDAHTYLSKMRQGYEGAWQFHLTYTAEPHDGAYILTFYLFLGHVARWTQLPLPLIFHLARLLSGWGLLFTLYLFIAHITPDLRERRLAFMLLTTSSGLGWLITLLGGPGAPIDLWLPEAFIPYTLYANPHFPLATWLMLRLLLALLWPRGHMLQVAGLALLLVLVQPFAMLTCWGVVIAAGVITPQITTGEVYPRKKLFFITLVIALPIIGYDYSITQTNPIMAGWAAQNITLAPPPLDILWGYGVLGLLALMGLTRPKQGAEWVLVSWLGAVLLAIYLPFTLQRRLIHGLHIPIGLLAALTLRRAWPTLKSRFRNRLTLAVLALGFCGTLFVYAIPVATALQRPDVFYLRADEVAALAWLNDQATPNTVVLASPRLGMVIPSQTRARTFYGHLYETVRAAEKRQQVLAFYRGELATVPPEVDFIVYGPSEQALGQPPLLATLPIVFKNDTVTIYQN